MFHMMHGKRLLRKQSNILRAYEYECRQLTKRTGSGTMPKDLRAAESIKKIAAARKRNQDKKLKQ